MTIPAACTDLPVRPTCTDQSHFPVMGQSRLNMIRSNDSLWGEHAKLGALDNDPAACYLGDTL